MDKITATHLNFYYGSTKALKDVNLPIREHRVTAFIGPSGCGKSTFCLLYTSDFHLCDLILVENRGEKRISKRGVEGIDISPDSDPHVKVGRDLDKQPPNSRDFRHNRKISDQLRQRGKQVPQQPKPGQQSQNSPAGRDEKPGDDLSLIHIFFSVLPLRLSTAAIISLVEVFPTLPVTPATKV